MSETPSETSLQSFVFNKVTLSAAAIFSLGMLLYVKNPSKDQEFKAR